MWRSALALVLGVAASSASAAPYLALGDSYTIGEGVAAPERWPNQLADMLRKNGVDVGEPEIVAKTGWTTDELSAAMDAHTFSPPYRLVTLLIGVNNQYRGRDLDNYRVEFRKLLERAHVLVVPGSGFNLGTRNHFRVTLLPRADELRDVFVRIEAVLQMLAASQRHVA